VALRPNCAHGGGIGPVSGTGTGGDEGGREGMRERRRGVGVGAGGRGDVGAGAAGVRAAAGLCVVFSPLHLSTGGRDAARWSAWPLALLPSWKLELGVAGVPVGRAPTHYRRYRPSAARSAQRGRLPKHTRGQRKPRSQKRSFFSSPEDGVAGASCKKRRAGVGSK
jgi:hypothetical protein